MSAVAVDAALSHGALRAAQMLEADYERQGSVLFQSQVGRIVDRRKLDAREILAVYDYLTERRIPIKDDTDLIDDDNELDTSKEPSSIGTIRLDAWQLRHPLLSATEERELGRQVALSTQARESHSLTEDASPRIKELIARGQRARARLVACNVRLVVNIARKYVPFSGMSLEDLVQEGIIGLMRAIEKFDPSLGYRFSTYATWWIRQGISRSIADRGRTVRLPAYIYIQLSRLRYATRVLTRLNGGRPPTLRQLSDELLLPSAKVQFLRDLVTTDVLSLDAPRDDRADGALVDIQVDPGHRPDALLEDVETRTLLQKAVDQLSPRERKVLMLRFGMERGEAMTLEQVGRIFDLTRERIRQIQEKALKRLRRILKNMNLQASAFSDDYPAEDHQKEVASES